MSKELSPKYNPAEVEAGRYQKWLDEDVFKPSGDQKAKPYSIVIPPPNVTGKLHLGHAWDTTLQDIIICWVGNAALNHVTDHGKSNTNS